MKRRNNCLTLDDDFIRKFCNGVARTVTMQIGYLSSDGNTSDMMDLGRHNKLVDELVLLVKKFVRKHPEYDSYAGITDLGSNEEFKAQMVDVVGTVMDIGDDR